MSDLPRSDVDDLRAYLSQTIAIADNERVPDGYAGDLEPDSEYISDWSTYLADKVLQALSDGGLTPETICTLINNWKRHN